MSDNLFIQYETGDTDAPGSRPIPNGATFWSSPGIFLDTSPSSSAVDPSTYTPNGEQQGIWVVVQDKSGKVPYVFVEVWVCDPATIVGPDTALYPSQPVMGQPPPNKCLTQNSSSEGFNTDLEVGGFYPYVGMSSMPGGHVCLIANCYGSSNASGSPISDGHSYNGSTTADLASLVLTDAHVAQHNIFAAPMSMSGKRRLSFHFNAVAAVPKGEEKVVLEILNVTGDKALTKSDLAFLRKGPSRDMRLHASQVPPAAFAIEGGRGGPARHVPVEVHAGHPVPLSILVEIRTRRTGRRGPHLQRHPEDRLGPRARRDSPSGGRHLTVFGEARFRWLPRPR